MDKTINMNLDLSQDKAMISKLHEMYADIKPDIIQRLEDFASKWETGNDEDIFAELVFCLLTPQSKAKVCWPAVERMVSDGSLFSGDHDGILECVSNVRFKNNKTKYIMEARQFFLINSNINIKKRIIKQDRPKDRREWLVNSIKGMGYKEASHFLRNIGMGQELAILDRHILRNLVAIGIIDKMPTSISPKRYLAIEEKMAIFASDINIPMDHLDLLLWYKEAGEIFK